MSEKINRLFSDIYEKYDTMNHVFSLGNDILWRRAAAKEALSCGNNAKIIDVGSGTGDLAIYIYKMAKKQGKKVYITATDFNKDMLNLARKKAKLLGMENVVFELDDAIKMKYENASFDVLITGFALRNFDDLGKFIDETKRVLKLGGKFVYLDMAMPDNPVQKIFFKLYFSFMRVIGNTVNSEAYNWLFESVSDFDKQKLLRMIRARGFKNVKIRNLTTGVAYIITGEKPAR